MDCYCLQNIFTIFNIFGLSGPVPVHMPCTFPEGLFLLGLFPIFFLLFSKFLNKNVEFFSDEMYN